jgi:hypothetical protein
MSILGPDGGIASFPTGGLVKKEPIVDFRIVVFARMMPHPQTKELVMIPMQDFQYKRQGSDEWFSVPFEQFEKHVPNPEDKSQLDDVGEAL